MEYISSDTNVWIDFFTINKMALGKIYGYDYSKGKLTINPTEAEVVRLIFKLFLDGNGTRKIGMISDLFLDNTKRDLEDEPNLFSYSVL